MQKPKTVSAKLSCVAGCFVGHYGYLASFFNRCLTVLQLKTAQIFRQLLDASHWPFSNSYSSAISPLLFGFLSCLWLHVLFRCAIGGWQLLRKGSAVKLHHHMRKPGRNSR
ncbi:uncharacterized protein J3D65DRAFT_627990 [Phyllosticta citribraziliensis]|uniref:Uncharacterized protein n=1 Tax=Phyllosticta citribraziliensis TaxID=989973 RepID=A0ABR1LNH2_9PEZI